MKPLDPAAPASAASCCSGSEHPLEEHQTRPPAPPGGPAVAYRIATMDCAAEESQLRRVLEPIAGIRSLGFHLGARTLVIQADNEVQPAAVAAIRKAGFNPQALPPSGADNAAPSLDSHGQAGSARLVLALLLAIGAEGLSFLAPHSAPWQAGGMAIAAIGIALAGFDVYTKGISALRHARLNINALMSVAVTGAFLLGQWAEAAMVMALYAIAELIEARAIDRARHAIKGLLDLAPESAEVRRPDGTWHIVPASEIQPGTLMRLKPGERVALDGRVTRGTSAIDQAPVTGESIPVEKSVGDPVFAGTINTSGSLEFTAIATAGNSTLARIIHAVEQAQGSRAPTQRFVDRFAAVYTPLVFIAALAVALAGPMLFDWTWTQAIYKALVLLVIACPCALVISTPVTVVSGLAAAARRGILIKGGSYLEQARSLKAVALDKTGTITAGTPALVAWNSLGPEVPKATIATIAASLASRSDHPVSRAIAAGLDTLAHEVDSFKAIPGQGSEGLVQGRHYVLGNHRLIEARRQCTPELETVLQAHERAGHTVTLLASDDIVLAIFAVADTIKPSSRKAIASLKALGVQPVMLTGDNSATAKAIGRQAGIDDTHGDLLPQDKLAAIRQMQTRHGLTGMAGDGINDAPALAQADIGFAMGAGTDIALEAADIVIMTDDLGQLASTVELSRKTHAVLWQNISLALGIKAVFFYLAIFDNATMWMAVFADVGASLLVVFNGLRLLRYGRETKPNGRRNAANVQAPGHPQG